MNVKKICLAIVAIIGLIACKQSFKQEIIANNMENINAQNIAEEVIKKVKHYNKEPYYYLYATQKACYYEILVNDVPVFDYYKDGQSITPIPINSYINKSGKQTITYKLYPQLTKEGAEGYKELLDRTEMKIDIFERNNADTTGNAFASERKVSEHHSAYKPDGKTFIANGKEYYEYTFSFDAQVPYVNKGWEDSEDLRKMDQKKLLEKTENAYKQLWELLKKKDVDAFFKLTFGAQVENCQAEYFSAKSIKGIINDNMLPFETESYKLEPLEGYRMNLYGNGRIACLELTSMDPRIRGGWAIWGKYTDEDGDISTDFTRFYLHIPKGKTNFEIIR